jgi:hypothetical protein
MAYGTLADIHVDTTTLNFFRSSSLGTLKMFLSFLEEYCKRERGMLSAFLEGAFIRKSSAFESVTASLSAMRSDAELLGAQTKIFALV